MGDGDAPRRVGVTDLLKCTAHFGAVLALLRVAARHVGVLRGPLAVLERRLERYTDDRSEAFDRRYGMETFTRVALADLGQESAGYEWDGWRYAPIDEAFVHEIIRHAPVAPREVTFVDVGSGKAKALMVAAGYPFRRVVGIELSEQLTASARANCEKYRKARELQAEVELICGDFMRWTIPAEPTLLFLNNPFPFSIAELAIRHIEAHVRDARQPTFVAYRKAPADVARRLDASLHLELATLTPFWRIYRGRPA